jgi:hypothetical protein
MSAPSGNGCHCRTQPAGPGSGAYGNAEKTVPRAQAADDSCQPCHAYWALAKPCFACRCVCLWKNPFKMPTISVREKSGLVSIDGAASTSLAFSEPGQ